jgi:hypothetical protein
MRRQIVFAQIRLHFHDFARAENALHAMHQQLAQQFPRNERGVAIIETAREPVHGGSLAQFPI